jgi:beta-glucosidase
MKNIFVLPLLLVTCIAFAQQKLPYQNAMLPVDQRVKDLLGRMTPEEKAGQLNQLNGGAFTGPALGDEGQKAKMIQVREGKVGSLLNVVGVADTRAIQQVAMQTRLGIPLLFGYDVIHGYRTVFPIPLAEACSWNLDQIQKNSAVAAKEAAASGVHWTFAPMCDISNDTRWGRVMEGAGEDPYYGGLVAAARVKGFQGDLKGKENIMACVKHFAAYGAVEAGREYNTVDVSRVQLWNKYFPPYKAAVEAGASSVMNSFNVVDGVPASGNKFLVTDVLKKKWGFKGFLVSDWGSFKEMINHGYATDDKDVALKAIQAGSMMDMESLCSYKYLPELLKEKKISMQQLDEAVAPVLAAKFKMGLFEDPYKYCNEQRERINVFNAENRAEARKASAESVVLLKNNKHILPLKKDTKVSLVGLYAGSKDDLFDFWIGQGKSEEAVTVAEAMAKIFSNGFVYSKGYLSDNSTTKELIAEAINNSAQADVIVVNIGISGKMAGEDRALAYPQLSTGQIELLKALHSTGKPLVALVSSGRPLVLTEAEPLVDAMLQCWILGTEHGNAITDVLSGDVNPSAKTVMTFPYAIGQIPVYYNHFNTNRPNPTDPAGNWYSRYRDIPNEPLYPFGYGLSYTDFSYTNLKISSSSIKKNEKLTVTVTLKNTGSLKGVEVVQLYIRDYVCSVIRPVKELKGFQKISLEPGASKEISFTLTEKELAYMNAEGKSILEPGKFSVFVGGNSRDVLQADFELK